MFRDRMLPKIPSNEAPPTLSHADCKCVDPGRSVAFLELAADAMDPPIPTYISTWQKT